MVDTIECSIESVFPLTESIVKVHARSVDKFNYIAGQFVEIKTQLGDLPYSIANAPIGGHHLEFHIRHGANNQYTQNLLNEIKDNRVLNISAAKGECTTKALKKDKPVLLIAVGTGFAPIKAMIEQLLFDGFSQGLHLFWLAKKKVDLYMDGMALEWSRLMRQFHYTPLYPFQYEVDNVAKPLVTLYQGDLTQSQVVASGPFDMVFSLRDALTSLGVKKEQIYSDAFFYSS